MSGLDVMSMDCFNKYYKGSLAIKYLIFNNNFFNSLSTQIKEVNIKDKEDN